MIGKLLIANRGEIAVRVIRAAREMGVRTVAVYSEADADAQHVQLADEAVAIGPSESTESYLSIERILAAAAETHADAIHPGYGFLSERAAFSAACRDAGIHFLGPSPEAMQRLGSKIEAKQLAVSAGVPVTPGFFEPGADQSRLKEAADAIGYPVMLKASAGGGGRGMRIVRNGDDFDEEFRIASDEALKGFGDGAMMVEKLIEAPRHIEVQVLADQHGQVRCLFERECSLQRRRQKLIEEAPSPAMHPDLWHAMREATERLIHAADYVGAGTAEFMVQPDGEAFYFLEVNARLQVEHPVTEAITGLDLVQWQIRIANGEALPAWPNERSAINGHAIEARIVAEDPAKGFLPSIGDILCWAEPHAPGVRVDAGYRVGSTVSRFYDSLLAKVIAHGATRDEAIARLRAALLDFHILGVRTNIAFHLAILDHPAFVAGELDTGFLDRHFAHWSPGEPDPLVGALASFAQVRAEGEVPMATAWSMTDGFRLTARSS